jgi:hypothetical protein
MLMIPKPTLEIKNELASLYKETIRWAGRQWLTSVILSTQEAEIRIAV